MNMPTESERVAIAARAMRASGDDRTALLEAIVGAEPAAPAEAAPAPVVPAPAEEQAPALTKADSGR